MRIVNWNVNSIRARAERIGGFLDRSDVDVLAIQELKCRDDQFPEDIFSSRGYEVAYHGLNQWNGVAIASRVGLENVEIGFAGMPEFNEALEARALSADSARASSASLNSGIPAKPISTFSRPTRLAMATPFHWLRPW